VAGKQGFCLIRKTDYFAFFHVFVLFLVCNALPVSIFRKIQALKKNRAEKPTVGFLFLEGCGKIIA
jgi:hypothetical protein